jgi:8-oxo-dGTP diphosphatase
MENCRQERLLDPLNAQARICRANDNDSGADKVPLVGVGCIVVRDAQLLLVRNHRGFWSTPGGHLDLGESLEACAARETLEETGVSVTKVEFVAITNDVFEDAGKHYVTIWMRGEAYDVPPAIGDPAELAEIGWFAADALPAPLHLYFQNLIEGRCLPRTPANMPFAVAPAP